MMQSLYDLTAEQSVLGGLIMNPNQASVDKALSLLNPNSFYVAAHQIIFKAIKNLVLNNKPVDLLTLENKLKSDGNLEKIGGFAYLAEIVQRSPNMANVLQYAAIVKEDAIKRFTLAKLQDCQSLITGKSELSANERIDLIGKMINEISDYAKSGNRGGLVDSTTILRDWLNEKERLINNPESVIGITSGIPALDELLGREAFYKGALVVVGARPKCGKTTLLSHLVMNCVTNDKKIAAVFSLEMTTSQIFDRIVWQRTKSNADHLMLDHIDEVGAELRIANAAKEITENDRLYIDDTPGISLAHIQRECRKLAREKGEIGLIAVDYLTLMRAEKAERNDLAYGEITKRLKELAKELNCVVLLLTQLNRGLENRTDKRPKPSDSRDTGQIEQDCDFWIGLHRPCVYSDQADKYLLEIILGLRRNGNTGTIYADFINGVLSECDQVNGANRAKVHVQENAKTRKNREF
ncbi:replicative DNA helicase [Gallibacterium anatis]|uniref:replicative DNA helicase n=1 Tax=Gallibacterium anatis TaxID=750 RepID=UPI003006BA67